MVPADHHHHQVSPAQYMEAVDALRPSAYVTMADDLPRVSSDKRSRLAVERTSGVCALLRPSLPHALIMLPLSYQFSP